jgi:hypothetical protein
MSNYAFCSGCKECFEGSELSNVPVEVWGRVVTRYLCPACCKEHRLDHLKELANVAKAAKRNKTKAHRYVSSKKAG